MKTIKKWKALAFQEKRSQLSRILMQWEATLMSYAYHNVLSSYARGSKYMCSLITQCKTQENSNEKRKGLAWLAANGLKCIANLFSWM